MFRIMDENGKPVEATLHETDDFLKQRKNIIRQTFGDSWWLSTVFLIVDHDFAGRGTPIHFETMLFRDGEEDEQWRFATREEALAKHETILKRKVLNV